MVTESIMFVERYMELLIKEASEKFDIEEKARVFEKYLRFWSMIVCAFFLFSPFFIKLDFSCYL